MRKAFYYLLAACLLFTACGTSRRVSSNQKQPWVGATTSEILMTMGDPDRIDGDGKEGSVLVYESAPDFDDPGYDILDPQATVRKRTFAYFFLDREGTCYAVETNRSLPTPPNAGPKLFSSSLWADILFSLFIIASTLL